MLAALALVIGCDQPTATVVESAVPIVAARRSLRPSGVRPEEQVFDDIARGAPGFGGFYLSREGDVVVWSLNPGEDTPLRASGALVRETLRIKSHGRALRAVKVVRGRFTFWELARARDLLFDEALGRVKGMHGLDLDERANRVAAYFGPGEVIEGTAAIRRIVQLAGLDTAMLDVRAAEPPVFDASSAPSPPIPHAYSLISGADTIVGGLQWSNDGANPSCSVGVIATYGGNTGMFSASHCSSNWWGVDGTPAYLWSGNHAQFGSETVDPNGSSCWWWDPIGWYECRFSDAAFWQLNGAVPAAKGLIARTAYSAGPGGSTAGSIILDTSHPYLVVTGTTGALYSGELVEKMGWVTGWTWGYMDDTCRDAFDNDHVLKCQYAAAYWSAGGDSGSPVFQRDPITGDAIMAGLHTARDGGVALFSPWWRVSDEFSGGIDPTRGYALATPTLSGSLDGTSPVVSWSAVSGATEYHLYREWYRYATGESEALRSLGAVSSPARDLDMSVTAYTGASIPGPQTPGYVAYYLVARNNTDRSQMSSVRYFQLSP
ncbi:MAG: hypothetical protein H3C62_11685 [Gemmatimonadaceae bacterium]|nr:hypothetical protein [Gemmatimonadaceae bacterium]